MAKWHRKDWSLNATLYESSYCYEWGASVKLYRFTASPNLGNSHSLKRDSLNILVAHIIARQQSCGKVMFSVVPVWSTGAGVPCDHYLTIMHWTWPYSDPLVPASLDMRSLCTRTPTPLMMGHHCTGTSDMRSHCTGTLKHRNALCRDPPGPPLVTCVGQDWRPVQTCLPDDPASDIWWPRLATCSLEDPPTSVDTWWLMKHVQLASGWYTSYWNDFLFHKF